MRTNGHMRIIYTSVELPYPKVVPMSPERGDLTYAPPIAAQPYGLSRGLSKVPQITAWFWITKVLTTGVGETTSDFLAHTLDPFVAVGIGFIGLAIALTLQFRARRYVAWIYWLAVVMVSVFGTMAADVLHVGAGVPYAVSAPFFLMALTVIFVLWFAREKTLSIHSITTARREFFYWATVMATFALGTATGDLTASTFKLGYFASAVMFTVVLAIPALAHWKLGMNPIFAFWFAYIITRPVGASFADWMGVSHARSGLAWGTGPVSAVLAILIVACVGYLTVTRRDVEPS